MSRYPERGFTLVEVMIALLIFGMIAAAGVALLSFSVRAQAATDARLGQVSGLARFGAALSADLAQAQDRPARDETGTVRPAFVGDGASITFVRAGWDNLDDAPRPNLQKVTWRLAAGAVERQGAAMLDGGAPLPAAAILDHVRTVTIRYRLDGAWRDRFDGADGVPLPQAVEVTVVRDDGVACRQLFYVGQGYRPQVRDGA